ncbi:MAG: Fe-S cluster assembly protein SufD [Fidelibacterota bacterium]|jgi:Fe-S cluster assembly protein SufD|tara:strand:- start:2141 stop:3415 length:1275 start_codon:yes stop_codon:yes gene_type:complete
MKQFQKEFNALLEYWPDEDREFRELRLKAFDQFKKIGFPTKKWEEWQFTDFSLIKNSDFHLSWDSDIPTIPKNIPGRIQDTYLILIVNGHYQPQLSDIPDEVSVVKRKEHFKKNPELYSIESSSNPFLSLNTSMMNSGLPIYIKENAIIKRPLQIIYLTTNLSAKLMNHPRFSCQIGENAEATIIEHYTGSTSSPYFTNAVSSINLEKNSRLNHIRIQEEDLNSNHTAFTSYTLDNQSQLEATYISSGSLLFRHNVKLILKNKGANATVNGLSLTKTNQHHDQHIIVDHASDSCQSDQLFKYILSDRSSGVFNGKVIVREKTKQTNANQSNKNLLLSPNALMNANPQLEIYADDVKCSHGSTTGQIDSEALFYLRSRGISQQRAMELIVSGFAKDIIDYIKNTDIKSYISEYVFNWLEGSMKNV